MDSYDKALKATSKPWAPWYAIPADDKPFLRHTVAHIVEASLASLDLEFPEVSEEEREELQRLRDTIV